MSENLLKLAGNKIRELKLRIQFLEREVERGPADIQAARMRIRELEKRIETLKTERDTPEIKDFLLGVQREAQHQRARWGSAHDSGKSDADWFWLVGYLVGKALHKDEKRLHHLIAAAAALYNWHLHTLGKTDMRPGIVPP